ncbi:DUF3000 domain-containing protein [Demequina muriae]|uniref:DUF3000 domain-containing protein n=1 Tax=Demequina muriae TaxID=3051664 RepID=A0ABT8GJJ2_9MICO|nr:DUF3000 domain-containing protein [Demequina sp. EGI L300058]MDN4481601.1 DUF3000 domain-containing protein [Demequina sp. EGI L300058]
MARDLASAPPAFQEALRSLAHARTRRDVVLTETPAPSRIAPFAAAIDGHLTARDAEASGRFVVLHDPEGQDAWEGVFRVVALVKAQVDAEVGADDLWAQAAWSWLDDALQTVPHRASGGTVTKTVNESFGELATRPSEVQVELRVSWTPTDTDLGPHIAAWTELMASCAGVPPVPEGVTALPGGDR